MMARARPEGFYHGVLVRRRSVRFVEGETEQLSLF